MLVFIIALLAFADISQTAPTKSSEPTCGYESCPPLKEGVYNLHLIPHSHDDVGWVKTVDEYYVGEKVGDGVRDILKTVVEELLADENKRFIYVETAFFWKWWQEQSEELKKQVRDLVSSGRLEFVGGGWVMNDEATTHYQSIIDQFTWGFRKLEDTFGSCGRPRVGWQIDPFGHSKENAAIMAGLGFDGLFLGRIDLEDRLARRSNKSMEMIWNANLYAPGDEGKLFTGVLYLDYSSPKGFCFDVKCGEPELNSDYDEETKRERVVGFLATMQDYMKAYSTKHILVPMGGDFQYTFAQKNYKNMDELIRLINDNFQDTYHALYSTPSCYLKALNEGNISFPTKDGDFFPYASEENTYWTGYFTSRPTLKRYVRIGNNYLQICKQLHVLSGMRSVDTSNLDALREVMGVLQHHDAIAGTEKEYVAHDYSKMLTSAIKQCDSVSKDAFKSLAGDLPEMASCLLLNISSCPQTETSDKFVLTLYNPLSRPVHHLVRVPVPDLLRSYTVIDPDGEKMRVQLLPVVDAVVGIPGRPAGATAELVFLASDLPPLGFKSYHVSRTEEVANEEVLSQEIYSQHEGVPFSLNYDKKGISLSGEGELEGVTLDDKEYSFRQHFLSYSPGGTLSVRPSGAYVFSPDGNASIIASNETTRKIYSGPVVTEFHVTYEPWLSQVIRIVNDTSPLVEFEWLVGPIPERGSGLEIISRFICPDIQNAGKFQTDSNGRSPLVRTRNENLKQNISGNYYPVVTDITIEDGSGENRLSIITDRAQGGSSLEDGTIELMVHRRLKLDDRLGVDEALNETAYNEGLVARGKHWLFSGSPDQLRLQVQEKSISSPWLYISPTQLTQAEWISKYDTQYSGLNEKLPENVHILTLEPWSEDRFLLRLENVSEKQVETLNILNLFAGFSIGDIKEMSLGGDVEKSSVTRLIWNEENRSGDTQDSSDQIDPKKISLSSYQIRTFLVQLNPNIHN